MLRVLRGELGAKNEMFESVLAYNRFCMGSLLCFTPPCVAVRLIASKRKQCGAQQRVLLGLLAC